MKKRLLTVLLIAALAVSLMTVPVEAATTSGQIGDLYWNYDAATHTLRITGNGDMPDHYYYNGYESVAPWRYYSSSCSPLDYVVVEEGVTSIGYNAFESLNLKSIQLPSTVKIIKYHAFQYTKIDMEQLILPSSLTEIEMEAFAGAKLKSLKLMPATITIGDKAFYNTKIESVNLENVETIGKYAFYNCRSLQGTLNLRNVKSLGESAFQSCEGVSGVSFGGDLTKIPNYAFESSGITSLEIPGNVTAIGDSAFYSCSIKSLKLHEGLKTIGDKALYLSLSEELELPSTVQSIGDSGLINNNSNRVLLNEGLLSVGYNVFRYQEVMTVPSTVESMSPRESGALIVLGEPFSSRFSYGYPQRWNSIEIYTWFPREQWGDPETWGEDEFKYVQFRILEPEVITLHEGQSLTLQNDPEQYELLDGWRVELNNGVLEALKPCSDVLIETVNGESRYHLIQVDPIPESCKNGNHVWDLLSATEPSCTMDGTRSYTCSACGTTYDEAIPALGHAWTLESVIDETDSPHASTGLYICARCNETKEAPLCAAEVFTDMPAEGNWAHDPIDWAWFNGITSGKTPTTFAPKDTVTRAESMTFLWLTLGSPEPETTDNPFADVKEGKYYYKPVLWAVENGITSGTGETTFGPKDPCTRAQILTFLWIAAGRPEPETTENPFADVKEGKYYYKAVLWGVENHITSGVAPDQFGTNNTCTRAQIVAFLYKAKDLMTQGPAVQPEPTEPDPETP